MMTREPSNLVHLHPQAKPAVSSPVLMQAVDPAVLSRDRLEVAIDESITWSDTTLPGPLRHVRGLVLAELSARLEQLFNILDDTLFELTDRAHHTEEQHLYLHSMRLVRSKKNNIMSQFKNRMNNLFDALTYPDESPLASKEEKKEKKEVFDVFSGKMTTDMLAVLVRMVKDARQHLVKPLIDLQQRLTCLVPGDVTQHNNPLDPQQICDAFWGAFSKTVSCDDKINLLIAGQFYRQVMAYLPPLIQKVNQVFSGFGVMPAELALDDYALLPAQQAPDVAIQEDVLRQKITGFIEKRLTNQKEQWPSFITELLRGPWLQVMYQVAVKKGLHTQAWSEICELTDALLKSISAEYVMSHQMDWLKSLSHLIHQMVSCLHQVGLSAQDMDYYLAQLEKCHRTLLDESVVSKEKINAKILALSATEIEPDGLKSFLRRAQQLQPGCEVEWMNFQGQFVKCKVTERSHHRFIFSDKKGQKLFEQTPAQIAKSLRVGELKII